MSARTPEQEDLIRRARQAATGASIHAVAGMLGVYSDTLSMLHNHPGFKTEELRESAARCERVLIAFLAHGNINRAKAENPR